MKNKTMKNAAMVLIVLLAFGTCKKHDKTISIPLTMQIDHTVDGAELDLHSLTFENAFGNKYSVTKLHYYLSGFSFVRIDGTEINKDTAFLVDGELDKNFIIPDVPEGDYNSIAFHIGLIPTLNETDALPNTLDNVNMAWPNHMGGGYHFLKLEGHFLDTNGVQNGYAFHLGTDAVLVNVELNGNIRIDQEHAVIPMEMNVNEWFDHPTTCDLNVGNYSMGDMSLMKIISENGQDVFTLKN